ncbi:MAG TPA: Flp pilus assembly protein CpaB [Acidimicrobiales bacterium]|nr:Flp pilus assembly protein CpaB [Acidimicrobiales bacterium]
MNPRQRRGAILLLVAGVGALGVFVAVASYVDDVGSRVGKMTTALELVNDVGAYRPLSTGDVKVVEVPERWLPPSALRNVGEVVGQVAAADLVRGSYLQRGSVVPRPALRPGQREVAILVDAETGVAGKVRPGSLVDILATFPAAQNSAPRSEVIVQAARVIDVGVPTARREETAAGFAEGDVVPVTFALSPAESLVVTYAESFGTTVRLGLLSPGDAQNIPERDRVFELGP